MLKESLKRSLTVGALNTTKLINDGRSLIVLEFFRSVLAVVCNRFLMRTDHIRLGIVRKDVGKDDLICIFYGCSVPIILRRHFKRNLIEEDSLDDEELEKMAVRIQKF